MRASKDSSSWRYLSVGGPWPAPSAGSSKINAKTSSISGALGGRLTRVLPCPVSVVATGWACSVRSRGLRRASVVGGPLRLFHTCHDRGDVGRLFGLSSSSPRIRSVGVPRCLAGMRLRPQLAAGRRAGRPPGGFRRFQGGRRRCLGVDSPGQWQRPGGYGHPRLRVLMGQCRPRVAQLGPYALPWVPPHLCRAGQPPSARTPYMALRGGWPVGWWCLPVSWAVRGQRGVLS